jgi:glycosyltransferase involved in cell wall biosynthesis
MISVITVVKDDAHGLAATFKSLEQQTNSDWEMIVVASLSIDDTLEVANMISKIDGRVVVLLQEALGIYEAMNLGLSKVKGSHIWFMNAGDTFASKEVLEHALATIQKSGASLVVGGYKLGEQIESRCFNYKSQRISRVRFAFNLRMSHQSMIFSTDDFNEVGYFDLKYRFASDFDFILKLSKNHEVRTTDKIYAVFRPGGAADQNIFQVHKEKHLSRTENFHSQLIILASIIWTIAAQTKIRLRELFI